ncbi:uncharacterized protein SAPINGB_P002135 [Magnusiomyces paraingens]|uniref:ATP synthase subunit K, mitochondrial n=1 Tax=Magnusiomyces paraingens TaxID=2606893 RepID=A0A5E8BKC4_9ASCO|nr:uncharacterized protein SAPINGB_P002135 [Saprochaete ingens]VVT49165.1 unnamed protein product [Saprochaete ingens]
MSGSNYVIFGKVFKPHQLAIATLVTLTGGILVASSGKKAAPATPAIQAESPQEADFITEFLKSAEAEEKK